MFGGTTLTRLAQQKSSYGPGSSQGRAGPAGPGRAALTVAQAGNADIFSSRPASQEQQVQDQRTRARVSAAAIIPGPG